MLTQLYILRIVIKNVFYQILEGIALIYIITDYRGEILPTSLLLHFIHITIDPLDRVFIILLLVIQPIALIILNILLNRLIIYGFILVHDRLFILVILLLTFCLNVFINLGVNCQLSE